MSATDEPASTPADMPSSSTSSSSPLPSFDFTSPPPSSPSLHNLSRSTEPGAPPLVLRAIRISSAGSVPLPLRPTFLSQICRPYLDPLSRLSPLSQLLYGSAPSQTPLPGELTDLQGLLKTAQGVAGTLGAFDLFGAIDVQLVPVPLEESAFSSSSSSASILASTTSAQDVLSAALGSDGGIPTGSAAASPTGAGQEVDIHLRLSSPRSRFFLKSSTDVGNVEGSANVQARIRNAFGGAESVEGNVQVGTRTRRAWNLSLSTPLLSSPLHTLSLSTHASERDLTSFASCFEGVRGLRLALTSVLAEGSLSSELAFEVGERRLGRVGADASLSIRRLLLPSPRSSLLHTLIFNSLDSPDLLHASSGWSGRLLSEVGGLGLQRRGFVKVEGEMRTGRGFGEGWAWSTSLRAGLLRTLAGQHSSFHDRFFLGGPTSIRSVRYNGLGPRDMGDSLGGDAHWSMGASVYAPVPTRRDWPLKLHAWLNAGQLVGVDQRSWGMVMQSLTPLLTQPTITTGLGLAFSQGPLRVELNFGLPLAACRDDSVRKGVQLGIGVEFL